MVFKVVLQEQKYIQDYLVLTEIIYPTGPRQSEIGCRIPEFATTDHFLNERPCQTYKRQLKTLYRVHTSGRPINQVHRLLVIFSEMIILSVVFQYSITRYRLDLFIGLIFLAWCIYLV